jgi:hypothetical protein
MRFVRDRSVKKVYLYVDNLLATAPLDDPLTFPLDSDRPLTFAYWESTGLYSYVGILDEVKIMKFTTTYLAPKLNISSSALRFGPTAVGGSDSLDLRLTNLGSRDSLKISSISSTSPEFSTSFGQSLILGKGDTVTLRIRYSPTAPRKDTAMVRIISNDLDAPITDIRLTGVSYVLNHVPFVSEIAVVPNTYYSVRVSWFRTVDDTANAPDPLTQYQVFVSTNKTNWTVVTSMLAIGVPQYYAFAGIPYSEWSKPHWFVVAAKTKGGTTYSSAADSLGPVYVTGMDEFRQNVIPDRFRLEQNYPNPFNPTTVVSYQLSVVSRVKLGVYDLLGREVAVLVNEVREPGTYSARWDASACASGVYYCRLVAGSFVQTRPMLLVR